MFCLSICLSIYLSVCAPALNEAGLVSSEPSWDVSVACLGRVRESVEAGEARTHTCLQAHLYTCLRSCLPPDLLAPFPFCLPPTCFYLLASYLRDCYLYLSTCLPLYLSVSLHCYKSSILLTCYPIFHLYLYLPLLASLPVYQPTYLFVCLSIFCQANYLLIGFLVHLFYGLLPFHSSYSPACLLVCLLAFLLPHLPCPTSHLSASLWYKWGVT